MNRCKHLWKEISIPEINPKEPKAEVFECQKCHLVTKDIYINQYYVTDEQAERIVKQREAGGYVCSQCDKVFDKPGSLGAHVAIVHKGIDVTKFFKKKEWEIV